ncbi:SHOCT domain-containing protein [Compostimonas suwonensis]|uniref:Putative oligomerization/nucleic acid binding protein n=1 Tax=Compostimonas suwonensis TaxID=1048394 RepID=A0A2M9C4Q6_9MICO|nr:SHOCT domain-containing protein [Compostimonas suwonensis]PJJ65479.1 putative oligomerization/nucleic acid binding protein [Compostimonas suwonensis]
MFRRVGRPGLIGLAARTAVVAGTATAVSGGMRSRQQQKANEQAQAQQAEADQQQEQMQAAAAQAVAAQQAAAPAPAAPAANDLMSQIQQLATLHSQGILSDDEFAAAKAKLLA